MLLITKIQLIPLSFYLFILLGYSLVTPTCIAFSTSTFDSSLVVTKESIPQQSISDYLIGVYHELTTMQERGGEPQEIIHVVLGNQSADMDSIVSAIAFAYANAKNGFYVPVINILRDELPLRGDVLHVFETLQINPNTLLYQEDLPFLRKLAQQGCVGITLVDHNRLAPDQEYFTDYVERIVDHHKEEAGNYPCMPATEKLITKAGSNATLIAEKIMATTDIQSPQLAYLLLSAILLDTGNLTKHDVTTEKDIATAIALKAKAASYFHDELYTILINARNAADHLTAELLLKKDYKHYKEGEFRYGIASIPLGVVWNADNRELWKVAFEQSLEKQQIHMLSALAYVGRDLTFIVYIPNQHTQTAFLTHIQQTAALDAEFVLTAHYADEGFFFFNLKHPLARKQLQPLLAFETNLIVQQAVYQSGIK